jgi:hypothetical protein
MMAKTKDIVVSTPVIAWDFSALTLHVTTQIKKDFEYGNITTTMRNHITMKKSQYTINKIK